jgi:glycerol-3-phosphate cytidylyltransferase-like family protein
MRRKKVFVSGCFDMLHSGHVCFLEPAAAVTLSWSAGTIFAGQSKSKSAGKTRVETGA